MRRRKRDEREEDEEEEGVRALWLSARLVHIDMSII